MAFNRQLDALRRLLASDLSEATLDDLAEYFRQIDTAEIEARGRAIEAMRATGASWRDIESATGRAQSTIRFWYQRYLDHRDSR